MLDALHRAGHKYLKLLFVLALAGSSTLFFIGTAIPKPPALVIILVGAILGVAIEWSYFVVSCDLTESITRGHKGGVALNLLYTLAGGIASWFLFTNAALHVGWAPTDDLIGLSRVQWAMILAGLIVVVVFVLSARRKPNVSEMDMSAIARSIEIHMPNAPQAVKMRILASMLTEAARYDHASANALPAGTSLPATNALPAPTVLPAANVLSATNPLPATVIEPAKLASPPLESERITVPPPGTTLVDTSDPAGVYANLPLPGVVAEQGNHRYTGQAGGPFRPGSNGS